MSESTKPDEPSPPTHQFAIQYLYLKDASFESPRTPGVFGEKSAQEINLQLNNQVQQLGADRFEVTLTLTVTCKTQEHTTYLVEIKQAGIFLAQGIAEAHLDGVLNVHCPTILFPFAREAVADLVNKGGFPQLMLNPIDFNLVYQEQLRRRAQEIPAASTTRLQ